MESPVKVYSPRRLSIFLTILSITFWSYSVVSAKFIIGPLGFISSLPVAFWAALVLLLAASAVLWASRENHSKLLGFQVCLLVLALWLTPLLIVGSYPYPAATQPLWLWGNVDYILRYSHFQTRALFYLNWPGTFIFLTALQNISTIGSYILIFAAPVALQLLYLLPLYIFLNNTLGKERQKYTSAGAWLFTMGKWIAANSLSPVGLSYFLFLAILAVISKTSMWKKGVDAFDYRIIAVLSFVGLALVHLLTSMAGVIAFISISILKKSRDYILPVLAMIVVVAWLMYGATYMFETRVPYFISTAFRLDYALLHSAETPMAAGGAGHQLAARIRIVYSALILFSAGAGFLVSRIKKSDIGDTLVLFLGIGFAIFALVVGPSQKTEALTRMFLYFLPLMIYFQLKLFNIKKGVIIFCLLVLVSFPLFFISTYGNISTDIMSQDHIEGIYSFNDNADHGYVVSSTDTPEMKNQERYSPQYWDFLQWNGNKLIASRTIYIRMSKYDEKVSQFATGDPNYLRDIQAHLEQTTNADVIYTNPDMTIYLAEH